MKQKWIITGIGIFLLGITLGVFYITHSSAEENEEAAQAATKQAEVAKVVQQEQQNMNPVVQQLPDKYTPCQMEINEIRDLYTDGEPIWVLPPEWSESKAIYYSGKGHVVVQGGEIHKGIWKFWSADDPKKVVLIRVIGR